MNNLSSAELAELRSELVQAQLAQRSKTQDSGREIALGTLHKLLLALIRNQVPVSITVGLYVAAKVYSRNSREVRETIGNRVVVRTASSKNSRVVSAAFAGILSGALARKMLAELENYFRIYMERLAMDQVQMDCKAPQLMKQHVLFTTHEISEEQHVAAVRMVVQAANIAQRFVPTTPGAYGRKELNPTVSDTNDAYFIKPRSRVSLNLVMLGVDTAVKSIMGLRTITDDPSSQSSSSDDIDDFSLLRNEVIEIKSVIQQCIDEMERVVDPSNGKISAISGEKYRILLAQIVDMSLQTLQDITKQLIKLRNGFSAEPRMEQQVRLNIQVKFHAFRVAVGEIARLSVVDAEFTREETEEMVQAYNDIEQSPDEQSPRNLWEQIKGATGRAVQFILRACKRVCQSIADGGIAIASNLRAQAAKWNLLGKRARDLAEFSSVADIIVNKLGMQNKLLYALQRPNAKDAMLAQLKDILKSQVTGSDLECQENAEKISRFFNNWDKILQMAGAKVGVIFAVKKCLCSLLMQLGENRGIDERWGQCLSAFAKDYGLGEASAESTSTKDTELFDKLFSLLNYKNSETQEHLLERSIPDENLLGQCIRRDEIEKFKEFLDVATVWRSVRSAPDALHLLQITNGTNIAQRVKLTQPSIAEDVLRTASNVLQCSRSGVIMVASATALGAGVYAGVKAADRVGDSCGSRVTGGVVGAAAGAVGAVALSSFYDDISERITLLAIELAACRLHVGDREKPVVAFSDNVFPRKDQHDEFLVRVCLSGNVEYVKPVTYCHRTMGAYCFVYKESTNLQGDIEAFKKLKEIQATAKDCERGLSQELMPGKQRVICAYCRLQYNVILEALQAMCIYIMPEGMLGNDLRFTLESLQKLQYLSEHLEFKMQFIREIFNSKYRSLLEHPLHDLEGQLAEAQVLLKRKILGYFSAVREWGGYTTISDCADVQAKLALINKEIELFFPEPPASIDGEHSTSNVPAKNEASLSPTMDDGSRGGGADVNGSCTASQSTSTASVSSECQMQCITATNNGADCQSSAAAAVGPANLQESPKAIDQVSFNIKTLQERAEVAAAKQIAMMPISTTDEDITSHEVELKLVVIGFIRYVWSRLWSSPNTPSDLVTEQQRAAFLGVELQSQASPSNCDKSSGSADEAFNYRSKETIKRLITQLFAEFNSMLHEPISAFVLWEFHSNIEQHHEHRRWDWNQMTAVNRAFQDSHGTRFLDRVVRSVQKSWSEIVKFQAAARVVWEMQVRTIAAKELSGGASDEADARKKASSFRAQLVSLYVETIFRIPLAETIDSKLKIFIVEYNRKAREMFLECRQPESAGSESPSRGGSSTARSSAGSYDDTLGSDADESDSLGSSSSVGCEFRGVHLQYIEEFVAQHFARLMANIKKKKRATAELPKRAPYEAMSQAVSCLLAMKTIISGLYPQPTAFNWREKRAKIARMLNVVNLAIVEVRRPCELAKHLDVTLDRTFRAVVILSQMHRNPQSSYKPTKTYALFMQALRNMSVGGDDSRSYWQTHFLTEMGKLRDTGENCLPEKYITHQLKREASSGPERHNEFGNVATLLASGVFLDDRNEQACRFAARAHGF